MCDTTAVFLMLAVLLAAIVIGNYVTKTANDRMDEILLGVVNGASIQRRHRAVMLYNQWLPTMFGLAGVCLLLGLGYLQTARLVDNDGVRLLAYILAGWFGWAAAMYLFLGLSTLVNALSALRRAAPD
jgi:hypothetical protein